MRRHNIDRAARAHTAARTIQRYYRGHRARRKNGGRLSQAKQMTRKRLILCGEDLRMRQAVRLQSWARMLAQRQRYRVLLKAKREARQARLSSNVMYKLVLLNDS